MRIPLARPRDGLRLELCDGANCEPGAPSVPEEIQPPGSPEPEVVQDTGVSELTGDRADGWEADFFGGQPVTGHRLTDADGAVVAEGDVEVDWVRVGGTEERGGPREADVRLTAG